MIQVITYSIDVCTIFHIILRLFSVIWAHTGHEQRVLFSWKEQTRSHEKKKKYLEYLMREANDKLKSKIGRSFCLDEEKQNHFVKVKSSLQHFA